MNKLEKRFNKIKNMVVNSTPDNTPKKDDNNDEIK